MPEDSETMKKRLCVGLLAHVDAGKTTLAEAMLYLAGSIKKLGRVDHRDSFLDTHSLERKRGITIFSKQARLDWDDTSLTLLDTPGHVDFSAETERTLRVLDCAVLVLSGTDGIQAHTETLWQLLRRHRIPVFLFFSKMDLPGTDEKRLTEAVQTRLDSACLNFTTRGPDFEEQLALCSEEAMEVFLEGGSVDAAQLSAMVAKRELFPCFFGSGLRLNGVEELLNALVRLAPLSPVRGDFGARVFKIARDAQGNRLTFLKLSGGTLRVRDALAYTDEKGIAHSEKLTQLRLYSGQKYQTAESVSAGEVCAALGLSATFPGQVFGAAEEEADSILEPVLCYRLIFPPDTDDAAMFSRLRSLQEEDPQLNLHWDVRRKSVMVSLMGSVQAEVFREMVRERFDTEITLDQGQILYRETIAARTEGVGHFEPLRHYAEVHLLLEPLPEGSGLVFDSCCSEDQLDRNWQRLILGCLAEKQHLGVLTGAPLTDVKISLSSGRAHLKHTEGGDFREAACRAVRQGLMSAENILLEPWFAFSIEVPPDQIGRVIGDIHAMHGEFTSPEEAGDFLRVRGNAPVSEMNDYPSELLAFTHGRGRISLRPAAYRPCRNQDAVVEAAAYDPEADSENPPHSVFCAHGAGFTVPWEQVPSYMHLESTLKPEKGRPEPGGVLRGMSIDDRELEAIMEREFGPVRRPMYTASRREKTEPEKPAVPENRKESIIVDGYNLIFAWDELKQLAEDRLDLARTRLQDILSNYSAFTCRETVLVFDGWRTPGSHGSHFRYHNIRVAYTGEGETADAYIERLADEIGKNYRVRVVTSDNLIRLSALRSGVLRTGAKEFAAEAEEVLGQIAQLLNRTNEGKHMTRLEDGKL